VFGVPFGKKSTPFFAHETQEDAMPAHVWQLHVRPGKLQDFRDILSSLVELAREQGGYRGIVALASGKSESPDVTLVALWDSLEAIRGSENSLFLTQAISRFLDCCEGLPHIMEQELLTSDFIATSARAKA
jgi:antibiotic biosynthesis monooxygenase (ABM) superfamily enzyme